MNTLKQTPLRQDRLSIDGRCIDETVVGRAHCRLIDRLERGEGSTWQEVIEAPIESVWSAVDARNGLIYRHLPDVCAVSPLTHGPTSPARYTIALEVAGRREERIGQVLLESSGSMIVASDLDPAEPDAAATLPTVYSLAMHEHPRYRSWTVLVLAGVTLGMYNPWLMRALGHQCSSIRAAVASGTCQPPARRPQERYADRVAVSLLTTH